MTQDEAQDEARSAVIAAIALIAPEIGESDLDASARLRQDLELDSLDFLRLVETIAVQTGVDIPESDYPEIATVAGLIGYVASHS
ncbi:phosphopantetheine-binding protein [Cryobacterium sp. MLB-32]|uniref:acyl carrier protein n=1 Tax=Cryobacterium sp. MLB-32 TaxID=1529318 RepID=UPI0004E75065|nr:phosphopantetheine-binding protein [Cryobacterium sp. MLB-32]KFF61093.1 phosphopantetheine-binding protein [Cryobacterium sp. MLB-32]